jgi:hypothetical protein
MLILTACAIGAMILMPAASLITSNRSVVRTPLPALTSTPLPTLTPTVSPNGVQAGGTGGTSSAFLPSDAAPSSGGAAVQPQVQQANGSVNPARPGQTGTGSSSAYAPANPAPGVAVAQNSAANNPVPTPFVPPTPVAAVGQPGNELVINLPPTPTATATTTPTPTKTPTVTPTPVSVDPGLDDDTDNGDDGAELANGSENWSFVGVRTDTSQLQNGMLLYGNLVNHAPTAQEIELVNATFFDARGNVIGQDNYIQAYWPGYSVPPGGASMPFQLKVNGLSGAADYELSLAANSSSAAPRDDFEFSEVKQAFQNNSYCVDGHLRNPGSPVQDYLIVTVVLYDSKDSVINFQDEQIFNPARVVGNQTYHFKICVAPPYSSADHYELQAWGY